MALPPGHILKRDDFSAVTVFSTLPRDVLAALDASDPYIDAATGHLDEQTGYGVLVTSKTTYVWSFANRNAAFSTCYTFASSSTTTSKTAVHALPHVVLVPRSSGREPGLLLAAIDGSLRFYDSITTSFNNSSRSQSLDVTLGANESVVGLTRCDASTYVLATSQSRLFRINIASSGGRLQAQCTQFTQSRGILGRLWGGSNSGGGGSSLTGFASEGIVSVVTCPESASQQGSKDVFAVGQRNLQKWRLADGGSERLLSEQDVARAIANSVMGSPDEVANLADSIGLEIIDAAARADGAVYILYSYVKQANKPLSFGIATIQDHGGAFLLLANDLLDYTALRDPRPYSSPHLVAPNGGPAVFVVFADSIVMTTSRGEDDDNDEPSSSPPARFEEKIALKDGARNRFLGFGSESVDVAADDASLAALSCLSAQSGALLVEFSIEAARQFTRRVAQPSQRKAAFNERLQNQLEQAVFFEERGNANPLSFAISSRPQGELETVAERISSEIVSSTSRYLATYVDLREHLADRLSRLVALIDAINANHLLSLLSHRTRSRLAADAELLSAGADLWRHYNQQAATSGAAFGLHHHADTPNVLAEAIEDVMSGVGAVTGNHDHVRAFFRSHLPAIIAVFETLQGRLRAAVAQQSQSDVRTQNIAEVGRIALVAYTAALRYRQASLRRYALEKRTSYEGWTCRVVGLQLLESLFVATEQLIHARSSELGGQIDAEYADRHNDAHVLEHNLQKELKTNLCELARCTLTAYEERISWLAAAGDERERNSTEAKYRSLRPSVLLPLVGIGRADRAFVLAEQHGDFRTLTELCVDPSTGNVEAQVQHYMRRYGRAFAFELFAYYGEVNQIKKLLTPASEWNPLLDEFLKENGHSRVSWLHDLKLQKYHVASETLLSEATTETADVQTKHVFLSLGKLAYLAELDEEQIGSHAEQLRIEAIDNQVDLVSVHGKLREEFRAVVEEQTGRSGAGSAMEPAAQADVIVDALLTWRAADEAYCAHYRRLTTSLLSNRVLTSEDLVDLLTLKDVATPEAVQDFTLALQVCSRATDLQESRLDAMLAAIWRRSILADDWAAISETRDASDEEMHRRIESSAWYATLVGALRGDDGDDEGAAVLRGFVQPLDAITAEPNQDVIRAQLEYSLRDDEGGGEDSGDRAGLLYVDVQGEVDRVRELVEDEQSATAQWIREARRRAEAGQNAMVG